MPNPGFAEDALVSNRTPVLLFGASATERRTWAEEAAAKLSAPLKEVVDQASLALALKDPLAVVFAPDVAALGPDAQTALLQMLHGHGDRPKLVLGLTTSVAKAEADGGLRTDLSYRLRLSQVNLGDDEVLAKIRSRRKDRKPAAPEKKVASSKSRPAATRRPDPTKRSGTRR